MTLPLNLRCPVCTRLDLRSKIYLATKIENIQRQENASYFDETGDFVEVETKPSIQMTCSIGHTFTISGEK